MDVREVLVEQGCLLEGDFLFSLKSGQVAQKYLNFDRVLPHYGPLCFLADKIVEQVTRVTQMIDVIGAPAVGAIPLAYRVQERMDLGPGRRPTVVFAEKDGESFSLQRWKFAEVVRDKSVLVVEDIATTGASARLTAEAIESAGGRVKLISFIWNRGGVTAEQIGFPVVSLVEETIPSWEPEEHPQWGELPLVNNIGHPEHFPRYPRVVAL